MKDYEYMKLINNKSFKKEGRLKVDWTVDYIEGKKTLLFLGSTDRIDWVINFLCAFIPLWLYKKYFVSIGWALAWNTVKESVCSQFSMCDKDKEIVITGHSYGSAIALYAGEELHQRFGIKAHLITFGSVRPLLTGIEHFRNCFASIKQYCHKGDLVCLCPPFFRRLGTIKIGKSWNIFKTHKWHTDYDNPEHYKE